ncbi:ABC transporter permease [Parabacteroides sp.]
MKAIAFKLVLRSWWRNKTFSIISILSLAIGIACTNLLAVFFIHEYNLEADNPNRDHIYMMDQDSPIQPGKRVCYTVGSIPPELKEKYPEVTDYLRLNNFGMNHLVINNTRFDPINIVVADPSFPRFFPYKVLYGDLNEALTQPNTIALMEKLARKFFGKENPIGQTIIAKDDGKETAYKVAAVLQSRDQSYLKIEALTGSESFGGGLCLLMTARPIDTEKFAGQMQKDGIQTFVPEGKYRLYPLQESYFRKYTQESFMFMNSRQKTLLYVGLISAILILLIACFNYINLNFSRLLQQVRMIHTEKLMGATKSDINRQLFIDTFLTVIVAFLLSLLVTHDLIPLFNSIVSGDIQTSFFFNKQVLPVITLFILLLSIIPSFYMSRKIAKLSASGYREFFTGNKKRRIVTALSIAQYTVSIGLIIATLTVNAQLRFIQKGGEGYRGLIEVGDWGRDNSYLPAFAHEIKKIPGVENVTLAGGPLLNMGITPVDVKNNDGSESHYMKAQYLGGRDYLKTLKIKIIQGIDPDKALEQFQNPVYITQRYADLLVPPGEDPVGRQLSKYDKATKEYEANRKEPAAIVAGIVGDLFANSLEEETFPSIINITQDDDQRYAFAEIKLGKERQQTIAGIKTIWEKMNPGKYFTYLDVYNEFMQRNKRTTELAELMIMYSLISLFLTCFGLFGMALYATKQRTKEIGIRKVNGATTLRIMLLLNKQFVTWIGIAFVIAVPLAWLFLNRWLEHFAHHTEMSVSHCLLGGISVLFITLLTVSWHSYKAASGNLVNVLKSE